MATENEIKKLEKAGKLEEVKPVKKSVEKKAIDPRTAIKEKEFQPILETIRRTLQAVDTIPTKTPQNYIEQFVIYENGATRRLYIYVGSTWRYASLT